MTENSTAADSEQDGLGLAETVPVIFATGTAGAFLIAASILIFQDHGASSPVGGLPEYMIGLGTLLTMLVGMGFLALSLFYALGTIVVGARRVIANRGAD